MEIKPVGSQYNISIHQGSDNKRNDPLLKKDTLEKSVEPEPQGSCWCVPFVWIWNVLGTFFKCIFPCLSKADDNGDLSKLRKKEGVSILEKTKHQVQAIISLLESDNVKESDYYSLFHALSPQARQELQERALERVALGSDIPRQGVKNWIAQNPKRAEADAHAFLLHLNKELKGHYAAYLWCLNRNKEDQKENE